MLKTVVLLNIFMETMITFFKDSLMNTKLKGTHFFFIKTFCNIINIKTFDLTDPNLLNGSVSSAFTGASQ